MLLEAEESTQGKAQRWEGAKIVYGAEYQTIYLKCMIQARKREG